MSNQFKGSKGDRLQDAFDALTGGSEVPYQNLNAALSSVGVVQRVSFTIHGAIFTNDLPIKGHISVNDEFLCNAMSVLVLLASGRYGIVNIQDDIESCRPGGGPSSIIPSCN